MQDTNDLHLFVQVVDQNGFASAARKLGAPRSRPGRMFSIREKRR
jgi:DNA-binding transcriptional LysR family regulator